MPPHPLECQPCSLFRRPSSPVPTLPHHPAQLFAGGRVLRAADVAAGDADAGDWSDEEGAAGGSGSELGSDEEEEGGGSDEEGSDDDDEEVGGLEGCRGGGWVNGRTAGRGRC